MKNLQCAALFAAAILAGCAPIPLPGRVYVPAFAADLPPERPNGACTLNAPEKDAVRRVGDILIGIFEPGSELNNKDGQADFFITAKRTGKHVSFAVEPARITLQDDGRQLKPERLDKTSATDVARLKFPAPSGNANSVTLSFQSGAIRVEGRPVNLAPVTFKRVNDPTVYLFPCIPA